MAKFDGNVLRCLASSLSNVISTGSKSGRLKLLHGNFFKIQYLSFGSYLVALTLYFYLFIF